MNESVVYYLTLNSHTLNVSGLNVTTSRRRSETTPVYGGGSWLFDDGQNVLWDNNGVVLTDK